MKQIIEIKNHHAISAVWYPENMVASEQIPASVPGTIINPEKREIITIEQISYRRLCIRTHVITDQDDLMAVVQMYAAPLVQAGDIVFITEKAVACTQQRAIPLADIKPRPLACLLSKFVTHAPYGIGLAMPETMECAIQECGVLRILGAAFVAALGRLLGRHGWFYQIAGDKARSIDGPCSCTLPPYNHYVVLGPQQPDQVAAQISQRLGCPVIITDINDLGGQILGASDYHLNRPLLCQILRDNPLGQCDEQTPLGIIRPITEPAH